MATILTSAVDFIRDLWLQIVRVWQVPIRRRDTELTPEIRARIRVQILLDYNAGLHEDYLKEAIDKQFSGPQIRTELKAILGIQNIVKFLSSTVAGYCFREGVQFQAKTESDQTIYQEVMDDNELDSFMKNIDELVYLCKTVFVRVTWLDSGRIFLEPITPEHVKLQSSPSDPEEIIEFAYPKGLDSRDILNPKGKFCYWTNNSFFYVDRNGAIISNPENPGNVNPYGVIPIVAFRESKPLYNEFIQYPGEELVNAQTLLNVMLTYRNLLFKKFNVPMPHGHNLKILNGQQIILDGSTMIETKSDGLDGSSQAKFEWITPNTNMSEVLEVINADIRHLMISQGIDPNLYNGSADRQSGASIVAMNGKLEERRQIVKLPYQYGLEELFDMVRIVWNAHNPDKKLSEGKVTIQIPEPRTYYASSQDKWADYNSKLQLNLVTSADLLLLERRDLVNKTEAEKIITANSIKNRSLRVNSLLTTSVSGVS